jgi:hypothetical protein
MRKPKQPPKPTPPRIIKGPIQITDERADLIFLLDFPEPPGSSPTDTAAQTRGRLLTYLGRIRRGEKVRCYLVPLDDTGRQPRVEWHPWPRVAPVRPRGRPRKDVQPLIERLRRDLHSRPKDSLRQRAHRLGLSRNTLRKYLPLAVPAPR